MGFILLQGKLWTFFLSCKDALKIYKIFNRKETPYKTR